MVKNLSDSERIYINHKQPLIQFTNLAEVEKDHILSFLFYQVNNL